VPDAAIRGRRLSRASRMGSVERVESYFTRSRVKPRLEPDHGTAAMIYTPSLGSAARIASVQPPRPPPAPSEHACSELGGSEAPRLFRSFLRLSSQKFRSVDLFSLFLQHPRLLAGRDCGLPKLKKTEASLPIVLD
jgi:hypothetical protein